jgi:hypothetical protein
MVTGYLKENPVKNGADVNALMKEMISIILESRMDVKKNTSKYFLPMEKFPLTTQPQLVLLYQLSSHRIAKIH